MSINVEQNQPFEVNFETGETGLVGTLEAAIVDNDGNTVLGPTSGDITENVVAAVPTGNYTWNVPAAPGTVGQYQVLASTDGTWDPDSLISEDLVVVELGATPGSPVLVPPADSVGPAPGPCSGWVAVEDVSNCCGVDVGSDFDLFEEAATAASGLLYRLSGRQWRGSCQRTVRPSSSAPCGLQVLARGHVVGLSWVPWNGTFPANKVLLPNYPVTEIVEVKVDGDVVPEDEYRLDGWRYLTRLADADGNAQVWPAWARDDLDSTEDNTFEVAYLHGQSPPQEGIDAAAQLACEIYKSCPGNEGVAACKLPKNATQVTRAGITINLNALHYDRRAGRWVTGMNLVDLFLNAYNPNGLKRPPSIWSPDFPQFAQEVGTALGS